MAAETFHSAMESFHLVQIRRQGVGGSNLLLAASNSVSETKFTNEELEASDMELEPPTWRRTLEHHVGGFERGGNFPSQSGKVARFRAIHTSACHLFTAGHPLQTFHSAMESFHLVQIRRHEVGGLEHGVGGANALSANNSTDTELESPTWSWGLEHVVGPSNITLEGLNEVETFHRRVEKLHDFGPFTPRVAICSHLGSRLKLSTLRWKVSTSFKSANKELEGRTRFPRSQLLVGGFERGGNFPSQSGKFALACLGVNRWQLEV